MQAVACLRTLEPVKVGLVQLGDFSLCDHERLIEVAHRRVVHVEKEEGYLFTR